MNSVTHIGPKSLGATLGPSFRLVQVTLGLEPPDLATCRKVFSFRRRKDRKTGSWGWEIGLTMGPLWKNLSGCGIAPYPATKQDARNWVCDFAEAHGFVAMETKRGPRKRRRPVLRVLDGGRT